MCTNLSDYVYNDTIGNNCTFDNDNSTEKCPDSSQPFALLISQQVLYALVCIVGLLGNTLVIYVVIRFSKMQTVTNMYIVNLAIADEFFLIGIPFLIVTMYKQEWIFGNTMCKVYMISTSINQFTSSIFLLIMSADRYIAVCHPISSPKWRTPFISRIVSLLAWTISAIFVLPVVMYASAFPTYANATTCNIIWAENDSGSTTFTIYSLILGFTVPLFFIFVFYCLVIRKLKTVGPKNKSKEKKRSHRKVTNLVLTVVTVYVLCWLPYWVAQVALISTPIEECRSPIIITIFLLASCLSYSNSAMNPILYAFLSDNFKKSFVKACTCATGKDTNAMLHMENSVFPRKKTSSERMRNSRGTSLCPGRDHEDEEGEIGPLVSKTDPSTSAITMTSRSNITVTTNNDNSKDTADRDAAAKNGVMVTLQPTKL